MPNLAFAGLVKLNPDLALHHLNNDSDGSCAFYRNWWLRDLLYARPEQTKLRLLEIAMQAINKTAVTFQQADATALPFADQSFEAVVCQFGVMFFPDKLQGYRQALRVLRQGGTFLFNVWDRIEANEIAAIVSATLADMFPENPPTFMARTPHGYNDIEAIKVTLMAAGFVNIRAEIVQKRSLAPSAREAAIGYCHGTPMRGEIETRDANKLELATDLAEAAIIEKLGKGPIDAGIQAIVFTAMRP